VQHRNRGAQASIVLLHGFGGDPVETWGAFPAILTAEPALGDWDVYSVGYSTSLSFDIAGVWSADPEIITLGGLLETVTGVTPLDRYRTLAFLAHSMGGLMLQRALLSHAQLRERVSHVLLYGTPSAGVERASPFHFWKRQVRDMARDSPFIRLLRQEWEAEIAPEPPFTFVTVAGDRDEFVPRESSLAPFPEAQQRVVYGNHLEIVKPADATHLGYKVALKTLTGGSGTGPFGAARLAVESREFQRAIDTLWPHRHDLDDDGLVTLALALESIGRRAEAIELLSKAESSGLDPLGVLAGRLKRRWLAERRRTDAEQAMRLYQEGLEEAEAAGNAAQASYHAINCAFMELAYGGDPAEARAFAMSALRYCVASGLSTLWRNATEAEAHLYLSDSSAALESYTRAVAQAKPWQAASMYQQAVRAADLIGEDALVPRLAALFGRSAETTWR
jgi:pimeloyl-ACP methyl ester carboxylesterase